MQNNLNYYPEDELDEELNIDLKRIFLLIKDRIWLMLKVGIVVFTIIVLSTFISTKKYEVDADLYINKTNSSNIAEINPYFISEVGSTSALSSMMAGSQIALMNELELMQSPLVIDKVIAENNLKFKKLFGIIPTVKTGKPLTTEKFLKKKVSFKIKKGTSVVSITYKDKDRELAYNVVTSIINNFIQLHKDLNTGKAKSDTAVLEAEYKQAKINLEKKLNAYKGLPSDASGGTGGLAAMSAFSSSASKALGTLRGEFLEGQRSEISIKEESAKVAKLATKLEWSKLVSNMSDSSNVIVIKEPRHLKDYEQKSPKLLINIILGIIFGFIAAFIALIYKELTDKKLSYSMLGENIIYDIQKDFSDLKLTILSNQDKKISLVAFENIPDNITNQLKEYDNITIVQADLSKEFMDKIKNSSEVILFVAIGKTDSKIYKQLRKIFDNTNKKVIKEVLI